MAFGGSSEIRGIGGAVFGLTGQNIFSRVTSDRSTDFGNVTGYFTGCGAVPYSVTSVVSGGGSPIGMRVGDLLVHAESTGNSTPGRVTWHSVIGSTANFSTGTYVSTGGWDITLGLSSTA